MISSLDHTVILVEDLERAVAGYGELGFRVTPGGEHTDGLTRNALVLFADDARPGPRRHRARKGPGRIARE